VAEERQKDKLGGTEADLLNSVSTWAPTTGDHVLGLVPLLANLLSGVNNTVKDLDRFKKRSPDSKVSFLPPVIPSDIYIPFRFHISRPYTYVQHFCAVFSLLSSSQPFKSTHLPASVCSSE
jgi:hypothetical protein